MDIKRIAIVGALALGGLFIASRFLGSGDSSGAGGGFGGGAPIFQPKGEATGTAPVFNINLEAPAGFGEFNIPSITDTIADTFYPGDPAGHVYASTLLPGYEQPPPPTKKEQTEGETGFTTRTGGGAEDIWIGGR